MLTGYYVFNKNASGSLPFLIKKRGSGRPAPPEESPQGKKSLKN
jgi:hypothetical protein